VHIVSNAANAPVLDVPLSGSGVQLYDLTTNIAGSGTIANVNPQSPPFTCTTSSCTSDFDAGTVFTLRATPWQFWVFAGWSGGGCAGVGDCTLTLSADTLVDATFIPVPLVQLVCDPTIFQSIQAAHDAATGSPAILNARSVAFIEDVVFNNSLNVELHGGFNSAFSATNGYSVIEGTLTVGSGQLTVSDLVLMSTASNAAAMITMTPDQLDFGHSPINIPVNLPITISNTGSTPLTISALSLTGPAAGSFSVTSGGTNPCPSMSPTLAAGGSCTVMATFSPLAAGVQNAILHIASDAVNSPALDVPLTGTGVTQYSLTVQINGSGTVNNISPDPGSPPLSCSADSCVAYFDAGSPFILRATPSANWSFAGWSGGTCSGSGDCTFTLTGDTTISAAFTALPLVQLLGDPAVYQSLQTAYNAAAGPTASLKARDLTFVEDFTLNQSVIVDLHGGMSSDFNVVQGWTILRGILTVGSGSLTLGELIIR
jgi:hypothetical protein